MKAIRFDEPGGPNRLYLGTYPDPVPGPDELLIQVSATALNRADLLQREGKYPPPPGASELLGLEMAGTVTGWGSQVSGFQIGDRVCGLLPGGGYAERAVLPAALALRLPEGLSFLEAAAIPEVFLTAHQALDELARLQAGERVLLHAGASGVGTAAIQLAKRYQARQIIVTASAPKHDLCLRLGAHHAIDYRKEDFSERVPELTAGEGIDVLVDFIGGPNFAPNLKVLAEDSRMVMLAFLGGISTTDPVNLLPILRKRIHIMGSTLRARSQTYKAQLTASFRDRHWAAFADGSLAPVIDRIYDWRDVAEAHHYMDGNGNAGKIVLKIGD